MPSIKVRVPAAVAGEAVAAAAAGGVAALPWVLGAPARAVASGTGTLDDVAALVAGGGLGLLLSWTLLVLLVTALARVPGLLGRQAAAAADRITPAAARRAARIAVGLTVGAGPVVLPLLAPAQSSAAGPAAGHAHSAPARAGTGLAVERPRTKVDPAPVPAGARVTPASAMGDDDLAVERPRTSVPAAARTATGSTSAAVAGPASPPAHEHAQQSPRPGNGWTPQVPRAGAARRTRLPAVGLVTGVPRGAEAVRDDVVVRRGDTLWDIAGRSLGHGATDAEVAVEWPRWYAANREVVGEDPDLILPGTVLRPPTQGPGHR